MLIHPTWPGPLDVKIGDVGVFAHAHNGLAGYCIGQVVFMDCAVLRSEAVGASGCCAEHGPEDLVAWIPPGAAALIPGDVLYEELTADAVAEVLARIGLPVPQRVAGQLIGAAA